MYTHKHRHTHKTHLHKHTLAYKLNGTSGQLSMWREISEKFQQRLIDNLVN